MDKLVKAISVTISMLKCYDHVKRLYGGALPEKLKWWTDLIEEVMQRTERNEIEVLVVLCEEPQVAQNPHAIIMATAAAVFISKDKKMEDENES